MSTATESSSIIDDFSSQVILRKIWRENRASCFEVSSSSVWSTSVDSSIIKPTSVISDMELDQTIDESGQSSPQVDPYGEMGKVCAFRYVKNRFINFSKNVLKNLKISKYLKMSQNVSIFPNCRQILPENVSKCHWMSKIISQIFQNDAKIIKSSHNVSKYREILENVSRCHLMSELISKYYQMSHNVSFKKFLTAFRNDLKMQNNRN